MEWTETDAIVSELKNLYNLLGKNVKHFEANIDDIADRLRQDGYNAEQVKNAKEMLINSGRTDLTYPVIKQAVKDVMPAILPPANDCPYCADRGYVVGRYWSGELSAEGKQVFSEAMFACICSAGVRLSHKLDLAQWAGYKTQENRKFGLCFFEKEAKTAENEKEAV